MNLNYIKLKTPCLFTFMNKNNLNKYVKTIKQINYNENIIILFHFT